MTNLRDQGATAQFNRYFAEWFGKIDPSTSLVLTPNKRLSRFLTDQYDHWRNRRTTASGRKVDAWQTFNCLSYQSWLQQQWEEICVRGIHNKSEYRILSHRQEQCLWESAIARDPKTPALLNIEATAKLAANAWRLIHEWNIDAKIISEICHPIFTGWHNNFMKSCREKNCIPIFEAAAIIIELIIQNKLSLPPYFFYYGFDETTPQFLLFIQTIQRKNIEATQLNAPKVTPQLLRHEFNDNSQQIEASARWAKSILREQPNARIGIVAPQLVSQRQNIEYLFNNVFDPLAIFPNQTQHAPGFNLSAGQSLDRLPLIATTLEILKCNSSLLELEIFSKILRSPFIGDLKEMPARSQLDIFIREQGESQFTLDSVISALQHFATDSLCRLNCPDLLQRLTTVSIWQNSLQFTKQEPTQWAKFITELLQLWGWPGERNLDSLEYQQLVAWRETMLQFSALDLVLGQIDIHDARRQLQTLLQQTSFQAQTTTSPIQILGVLEAAGLMFDYLWVFDLDNDTWPPAPSPNPLLSLRFQIEHNMPQCSSQRELEYAERLTQRFCGSADQIIFSSVKSRDDRKLSPSALIAHIPLRQHSLDFAETLARQMYSTQNIEVSMDNCGPRVTDVDAIRGGSQILKHQAACPFQAFARHRLHSGEFPVLRLGLSARERGVLVHNIMDIVWRKLRNQHRLIQMNDVDLQQLVSDAVNTALVKINRRQVAGRRFLKLEATRLTDQAFQWLKLEQQRPPFSVLFSESRRSVKLGKLPIQIRYDRVDKLEDGSLFVLDYKTGKVELAAWGGERPDEPQVPLYCIANDKKVSGAALGLIAQDEIAFKGIADNSDIAPGLKTPDLLFRVDLPNHWGGIIEHWRRVLNQLAREFIAGAAEVDPKHQRKTCEYCNLHSLCRIKEQFDLIDDESEAAADDSEGETR